MSKKDIYIISACITAHLAGDVVLDDEAIAV